MTFSTDLYSLSIYKSILFVGEHYTPCLKTIFPRLSNSFIQIAPTDKAYYHALCVMANNFTTILWQKFLNEMHSRFNVPMTSLMPILKQTLLNLEHNPTLALTGPLKRQDQQTIMQNLHSLQNDAFYVVYQSFVTAYQMEQKNKEQSHEHA